MLLLLAFIAMVAAVVISKNYEENGRLPLASTPRGKQSRIVLSILLAFIIMLFVLLTKGDEDMQNSPIIWIIALLVAMSIPIVRFIKFKR